LVLNSSQLVRKTHIVSAHEPTMTVHDWSTSRVAID
jgi:hypothetical protein